MATSLRQTRFFILLFSLLSLLLSTTANPVLPSEDLALETRAADYHIAVADQTSKTIRVFPRNAKKWNKDAIYWSFSPGGGVWNNLSDVKIRSIASHKWVALVAASGGKAGIIDINNKNLHVKLGDPEVLWSATPGGNPHAIERIPNKGVIVTAGSKPGQLTLYVPTGNSVNDFSKIKKGAVYSFPGAHGLLWDPTGEHLWALGDKVLRQYKVVGKGTGTKLDLVKTHKIPGNGLGHDLQPDYTDKQTLLVTDTYGAYSINTKTGKWTTLKKMRKLKSLVRTADGEYFWVEGDVKELGQSVDFGKKVGTLDDTRGWDTARFYKARFYDPAFE